MEVGKKLIWIGLIVGGSVGGIIPMFWGAGMLSFSSVVLTAIGGLVGIWLGFKLGA